MYMLGVAAYAFFVVGIAPFQRETKVTYTVIRDTIRDVILTCARKPT